MYHHTPSSDGASLPFQHIPVFARFQWLNDAQVVHMLHMHLAPPARGRKGYDPVLMVRYLMWKQVMGCTYRDLESVSGIDHTTFIKCRKRLMRDDWMRKVFLKLRRFPKQARLIVDSSFVPTYSGHREQGSAYSGHKEAHGFKLHQVIEARSRLPVMQIATDGAHADIRAAERLFAKAPPTLSVRSVAGDKGYDSEPWVMHLKRKFKCAVAIPVRHMGGNRLNHDMKRRVRAYAPRLYRERTTIERYFSRKKGVFHLGLERMRGIQNFRAQTFFTAIMEYCEHIAKAILQLFSKLIHFLFEK